MMEKIGLYVIITAPTLSYEDIARICVRRGVRYLQLREKHLDDREVLDIARRIKAITAGTSTKLVMNDRADLALLAFADVLHLGQGDVGIEDARRIVGDMEIGLSTHSLEQAKEALNHKPSYIGFGPIYPTTTKERPDPTVGVELLSQVVAFSPVPVVAIGGIFPSNVKQVIDAGAQNVCMVRHLMCDGDLEGKIEQLQNIL